MIQLTPQYVVIFDSENIDLKLLYFRDGKAKNIC